MTAAISHFIQPLDVLFLRGNRLFGAAGSYGEALVPPWPSLAAGSLRSALLAREGVDLGEFARGHAPHRELGTPADPGSFTVEAFQLAREHDGRIEPLYPLPADLSAQVPNDEDAQTREGSDPPPLELRRSLPAAPAAGLENSHPLPYVPVLPETRRGKPVGGLWLTGRGLADWLAGDLPRPDALLHTAEIWAPDPRIGIALNPATRSAEDAHLFTAQAVAMREGTGFVSRVRGATLPESLALRLGGDGRAASARQRAVDWPEPDLEAIARSGRARLLLTTPGLFAHGWLPTGTAAPADDSASRGAAFSLHGVEGRIVAAAVPRAEVISGWNLANNRPKPARQAVPAGAVYWLELAPGTTADALQRLATEGLWPADCNDEEATRRAEGFNRCLLATWPETA